MHESIDARNAGLAKRSRLTPCHAAHVNVASPSYSLRLTSPDFALQQLLQDRQKMEQIEQQSLDLSQLSSLASHVFNMATSATETSFAQALAAVLQLTQQRDIAEAKIRATSII